MSKGDLISNKRNFSKRKLPAAILAAVILLCAPCVYADGILDGTPTSEGGSTVFKADVAAGDSYSAVYGVRSDNTDYDYHGEVNINGGTVTGAVYGGRAITAGDLAKASNNIVNMAGGTAGTLYGGYAYGGNDNAALNANKVIVNGGSITGYIYGASADGSTISVTGNSVVLKNAQVARTVYGGSAFNTASWLSMLKNSVLIENTTVNGSVYGGYASGSATASNSNSVTIRGDSVIKGSVYGGYALSSSSDAKNNTVIIEGGTITSHIYGGVGRNAAGNTIVLKGGNLAGADLYGYSDGRKSHSGNTLEVWAAETAVRSAQNFENIYFIISDGVANTDKFMLKVDSPLNLSGMNVGMAARNGTVLNTGDRINLIDKTEGTPTATCLWGKELKGGTLFTATDISLSIENGALIATVTGIYDPIIGGPLGGDPAGAAIPEAAALVGGQVASVALLSEGNGLALDAALCDAKAAAGNGFTAFITLGGGQSDYYTSAHIDMLGSQLVAGLAKKIRDKSLLGLYFETGNGGYTTFNSFEEGFVFGEGVSQYYGAGIMFETQMLENRALYLKTLGRIGGINNSWNSDGFSEKVVCDTDVLYFGASFGTGYCGNIGKGFGYDVSGKLMWTCRNGVDTGINGEQLKFNAINHIKTALAARIDYSAGFVNAFLSLAWERDFNKKATALINGEYDVKASALAGNTGVAELGATVAINGNWQIDLCATGYLGLRKGLAGSALVSYSF